ncbi:MULTISPECIES: hypothetical protein [unclassified Mesorhizobium]|uniref:hypothetical protein n=1 Tax=unclassified Mesorhizobium TaxID=325217 RepID=UPI0033388D11
MNASLALDTSATASRVDEFICWSRMQAEAGQPLEAIVERKEQERRAGNGTFFWGVGNPPAVIASALARSGMPVRAIFSIMKSRPKAVDVAPERTVVWRRYIDAYGAERTLPPNALVTSRADSASGPKKSHYALMCYSPEPLVLRRGIESFDPAAFRNASGKGAPVGNSQVTALLRRVDRLHGGSDYEVNLSAWLTGAYWVRLTDAVLLTAANRKLIERATKSSEADWVDLSKAVREGPSFGLSSTQTTGTLL